MNALSKEIRLVSLLQPPPETFQLFDELILLSEGKVIYSGRVEDVVPYFESLGYELPERIDVADWLQALPTTDGAQFLKDKFELEENNEARHHLSSDEFHRRFYESEKGKDILENVENPIGEKNPQLRGNEAFRRWFANRFRNSWTTSLKLLIRREFTIW